MNHFEQIRMKVSCFGTNASSPFTPYHRPPQKHLPGRGRRGHDLAPGMTHSFHRGRDASLGPLDVPAQGAVVKRF
jgi:hypothetical protein